jgi:hypothetical protein
LQLGMKNFRDRYRDMARTLGFDGLLLGPRGSSVPGATCWPRTSRGGRLALRPVHAVRP